MDWKILIADLQAAGLSQSEIGKQIGKSQAWVADALSGRYDDLKWMDGEALRKLHSDRVRSDKRKADRRNGSGRRADNGKSA